MKRDVYWSHRARADLFEIVRFISRDDPDAADRVADRIDRTAPRLGAIPTGRPGRVTGTYETSVSRLPYIIAYETISSTDGDEGLAIIRIIHQSRDWPKEGWPQD